MDPDPPRPARHVDHEGRRVPDPRRDRDDDARDRAHAPEAARRPRPAPDERARCSTTSPRRRSPSRASRRKAIGRWFPYVASLLLFIFVVNIIGFIPLPLSDETVDICGVELPTLGIYAATSSLSVTLALALMTFVFTHVEGVRRERRRRLLQELDPGRAEGDVPDDRPARDPGPVHAAHQPLRPSLREHARRPHADPHLPRPHLRDLVWVFPISIVDPGRPPSTCSRSSSSCGIQAYIFAALSAIYIGSAIEPEHH